jgi:hypothetical protein
MQSWAFSRNRNFNCIHCKNPVADAMGFFVNVLSSHTKKFNFSNFNLIYETVHKLLNVGDG